MARQVANLLPPPPNPTTEQRRDHKLRLAQVRDNVAETWRDHFHRTPQYEQNVRQPQGQLPLLKPAPSQPRPRATLKNGIAQWRALCQRYSEVFMRDKLSLNILFVQAPLIALLTWPATAQDGPRDLPYFVLSLVPIWFGIGVAAREIIRERAIYNRERMVNLGLLPYVGSKITVLSMVVGLQCLILWGTLSFLRSFDFKLPMLFAGIPQLLTMILTGMVAISLGLLVSAAVKTFETATSLVPLLLIPQLLLCGLFGLPKGPARVMGALMPATWSFDEMKRLSAREVEVLLGNGDGAEPAYNNEGRGLLWQIRVESENTLEKREQELKDYKSAQENKIRQSLWEAENNQKRAGAKARQQHNLTDIELAPLPSGPSVRLVPNDLSDYVNFLHPWGAVWLNPIILLVMLLSFIAATIGVLRAQDIG